MKKEQKRKLSVSELSWEENMDWSTEASPPSVRPIIFVAGSPYEMGFQYGKEVSGMIRRNVCLAASDALRYLDKAKITERLEKVEAIVAQETPDMIEWWRGIADGAGLLYGDVFLLNVHLLFVFPPMCSTISVFGSASQNHKLITGASAELPWNLCSYGVILIAYPERGNSFISMPQLAGQMGSNFVMNSKGLACTFTCGEAARPEDQSFGYPDNVAALMYLAWKCDDVEQAKELYSKLNLYSGWVTHLADGNGTVHMIEHTSAVESVRKPGDQGEKDYILATNHFLNETMKPAQYESGMEDSYVRYATEEKLIRQRLGDHSVESIMEILSCHDYWDGGEWNKGVWSLDYSAGNCMWTPEMRDWRLKSASRCVGVPEDNAVYILQGQTDRWSSFIPDATGKYCKLVLEKSASEVVMTAADDAKMKLWHASKVLSQNEKPSSKSEEYLTLAKKAIWEGMNLQAKAGVNVDNPEKSMEFYGKAATCFCKAQIYSELAAEIR